MSPRLPRRVAVTLAVVAATTAASAVAAPPVADQGRLDTTVRFLQDVQNADGGYAGVAGGESDPGISSWVAIALAAAGINPKDQKLEGGADVMTFIERNTVYKKVTDWGRVLLAVQAGGGNGRDFGGVDLVGRLLGSRLEDGSFPYSPDSTLGTVNATAFAVLPLSQSDAPGAADAVRTGAAWLLAHQDPSGAWSPSAPVTGVVDADVTGAVIQALNAAGRHDTPAQARALAWLHTMQNDDGGFGEVRPGEESNTASTSWVVQGLWAAGQDLGDWRPAGRGPLDFLASMQQPDGSISWKQSEAGNPVWMTAYAGPVYAGRPLPIARVATADPPADPDPVPEDPPADPAPAPEAGGAGDPAGGGGRVLAGGGGRGAPLFSAPQPQSQGKTPRGSRQLRASLPPGTKADPPAPATPAAPAPAPPQAAVTPPLATSAQTGQGSPSASATAVPQAAAQAGTVTGRVIEQPGTKTAAGAPGLAAAAPGGSTSRWPALGLVAALALICAAGARSERSWWRGATPA
jgi:prenyltransferase beta subunit